MGNELTPVNINSSYGERIKESLARACEKIRTNYYVNSFLPVEAVSSGNTIAALPYVVPGGGAVTRTAKTVAPKFSIAELNAQSQKRLIRTLSDAEYREALERAKIGDVDILQKSQLESIGSTTVDPNPVEMGKAIAKTTGRVYPLNGNYMTAAEFKNTVKSKVGLVTDEELYKHLKQSGYSDDFIDLLKTDASVINVSPDFVKNLDTYGVRYYDTSRNTLFHENVHASNGGSSAYNRVTIYNAKHPVQPSKKLLSLPKETQEYYLKPDEIRARAMSLRRIHQTTGKTYGEILETWYTTPHEPNQDIDDLLEMYNQSSLVNYLQHFLQEGGKINYLEIFK